MKRFDKGYFYYSFLSSLRTIAVIILIFAGNIGNDENFRIEDLFAALPFIGAACLVLYLALVLYAWLYVRASGYELTDRDVRCQRGVLFRKSSVLPYEKIHAVNKKQGLIQRLFGIATLTVDSGATTNAFSAEITIIERDDIVDRLIADIRCRQEGKPITDEALRESLSPASKRDNLYTFNSKLKLVYAVLSVCGTIFALLILCTIAAIGLGIAAYLLRSAPDFSTSELLLGGVFFAVLLLILMSVISLIGGLVTSFVAYHDFTVFKNHDGIEISYGLFVRQTNTFKSHRIKAVKITEGPIKRLFGFAAVSLEVVGYGIDNSQDGNSNNSTAAPGMLFPLCKAKTLNALLDTVLPAYRPDAIQHHAQSYPAFILWAFFGAAVTYMTIGMVILTALLLFDVSVFILHAVLLGLAVSLAVTLLCIAINRYLQYRHAGIAIGNGQITLQNGTFVRTRTVIRQKDLIAIERITTPMRLKKGVCSYKIHFFTNALTNTVTVKNLNIALAEQLESLLRY